MQEIWKPVVGFEGRYEVSNLGRIKTLSWDGTGRESIMKPGVAKNSTCKVTLSDRKVYLVHRLVAQAFIPNHDNLPQVNHKDENRQNNCVDNLEWCTAKYNINYGTRNERAGKSMVGVHLNRKDMSKPVAQYDKEGNLIAKYPSLMEATRCTGINNTSISNCCKMKKNHKTAGGFKWIYS